MDLPRKPWSREWQEVTKDLEVSAEEGLSTRESRRRRKQFGSNRLRATRRRSGPAILVDQIKNPIVLLLAVAAAVSFSFSRVLEGISILIAVVINCTIGFFTELKAVRSMEALHRLSRVSAKTLRERRLQDAPSEELVPGDMVMLEAGDLVPADLRLTEASRLQIDESAITGESVPVTKSVEVLEEQTSMAERTNMALKGTAVTAGSGHGVVTATGMNTELGRVASMVEEAEGETTPLEKKLDRLAYRLLWITLGIGVIVAVTGVVAQKEILLIIETSIALAVAAIPEGLPIVATIALARGMWRMAKHNALINRLSAVETLGAVSVIFTDKTGTLTENRMQVAKVILASRDGLDTVDVGADSEDASGSLFMKGQPLNISDQPVLRKVFEVGVLCNNAEIDHGDVSKGVGDPMELALLGAGRKVGIDRNELLDSMPEVREESFDQKSMMMATIHKTDGGFLIAVKGAPEAVLTASRHIPGQEGSPEVLEEAARDRWRQENHALAEAGLRVLAVATRESPSTEIDPYEDLTLLGLIGLADPPRHDVKAAVQACRNAGITVIMVTGDQAPTARYVGQALGLIDGNGSGIIQGKDLGNPGELSDEVRGRLLETRIFARVNPGQKLDLITLHQDNSAVVAMTGDGVNDAPALKKADIGIAMGQRGTQVAVEAADMVLQDDAFRTISVAIQQGRAIFDNIRKFILFLLSGNAGEILIVLFAILAGLPLPILPLQILYLNMIGDLFPALALGVGKGDASKMERPPRDPKEPLFTTRHWLATGGYGLLIALSVTGSFALALKYFGMEIDPAVTVSFLTLAFARIWHVFNMRDRGCGILRNDVTRNPFVWAALALCVGMLISAVYLPVVSKALRLVEPGAEGWALIIGGSMVPWLVGQFLKCLRIGKP